MHEGNKLLGGFHVRLIRTGDDGCIFQDHNMYIEINCQCNFFSQQKTVSSVVKPFL